MNELEHIHRDWLGMAQPEGLVVTASSLAQAGANLTWPVAELQEQIRALCGDPKKPLDLRVFLRDVLGWSDDSILEGEQLPDTLHFKIEGGEVLSPRLAVQSSEDGSIVLLVGQTDAHGESLDRSSNLLDRIGSASQRFERLVRETGVSVGLLTNGRVFRLIYWPKGESPGSITFELDNLLKADGRLLLGAFHMLLCETRLLVGEPEHRLTGLLKASREYQNTVSEKLRLQVLNALRELLTGFQDADRIAATPLLSEYQGEDAKRKDLYAGLVTVLMRMVFVLYAEEKKLLPIDSELYADGYSLTQLYSQLVQDRDRHGEDALDGRFGAWARVITLFRALHNGVLAFHDQVEDGKVITRKCEIPARRGSFFNPDRFPFIEGRHLAGGLQVGESLDLPRVSDGVVFRVLEDLLVLGGERLQYKGLDVEQIGSVYEGLMGFDVEFAEGDSLCLGKAQVVVSLDVLLAKPGKDRVAFLKETTGMDLKGKAGEAVKSASTVQQIHEALAKRTSKSQEGIIPKGRLFLQPGEERHRTGSHYTPRQLTAPIVETALRPVLERLGFDVQPEQLLGLKICDPAMGSGAFLVEACRQLADHLVVAWRRTGTTPAIPADEDITLHARRLVALQCLYGVDKNPLAVELARLSLWLVTFAKLHPFTFVDHALRHGDSLVGLTSEQISSFSLDTSRHSQITLVRPFAEKAVREVEGLRRKIHAIGDSPDNAEVTELWREAQDKLHNARLIGDLIVASFFSETTATARRKRLDELGQKVSTWLQVGDHAAELRGLVADLREGDRGVPAFHWELEFPEVFGERGGFDAFVGNPPFAGKNGISAGNKAGYIEYLTSTVAGSNGKSDLVGFFFRRAFDLVRRGGTVGLIATNTIAQGDTRAASLSWICTHDGHIYEARRRIRWPGLAAVMVSVVHLSRGERIRPCLLDGRPCDRISAFLFGRGGDTDPERLLSNADLSFQGSNINGAGFTFEDGNDDASPLTLMREIVAQRPDSAQRIFPYIGGEELNTSPTQTPHRYVIRFGRMTEEDCREAWPELLSIVEQKVKPFRDRAPRNQQADYLRQRWWHWHTERPSLYEAMAGMQRVLANSLVSKHLAFAWLPTAYVYSHKLGLITIDDDGVFAVLQSRVHEAFARFFSSTMKDDLSYSPSDCFETFPFPPNYDLNPSLESIGKAYYDFRAALMERSSDGLTKAYNRFHDRDELSPEIVTFRTLHAQMDRAVLNAYGWTDIAPEYDFRKQLDESERYTWSEDTRDEVLARLLDENQKRAAAEGKAAMAGAARMKKRGSSKDKTAMSGLRAPRVTIERLKLENFTAFESVEMDFVRGINVFLGANGTGKSHALKVLYALAHVPPAVGAAMPTAQVTANLKGCFKPEGNMVSRLVRGHGEETIAKVTVEYSVGGTSLWLAADEKHGVTLEPTSAYFPTAFIPSRELLSMYEGFVGAYSKRELSFDQTYFDACLALNASPLIGDGAEVAAKLTASMEDAIGGKVVLEGERFSITNEGGRFEAHLVGEGLRKLAALIRLIQNGTITPGGVLFWDEPESNLNPRLTTLVASLLVNLAEQGVQIFIATHDYLLSNRLSLLSEYDRVPIVPIRLFAFYRKKANESVMVESGRTLAELPENPIVDEFAKHYDFERQLFAQQQDVK